MTITEQKEPKPMVVWDEPINAGRENRRRCIPEYEAIRRARKFASLKGQSVSDAQALDQFLVVAWAWVEEPIQTRPRFDKD